MSKFLVCTFRRSAHGNVEVFQTLDVRLGVLPRLDGRRTFDGDVTPGVELDDCDCRSPGPPDILNLDGAWPGREAELTIQYSRRDNGRLRMALRRDADRDTGVVLLQ